MSTVVYRDGILAADRQITGDNMILGKVQKVFVAGDHLVGITGAYADAMAFVQWASTNFDPKRKPQTERDVEAVVVRRDGSFHVRSSPLWVEEPITTNFYASGSGSHIAIGALAMGADPVKAVQIACEYDIFSGGGIDALTVEDIPRPKRKRATTRSKAR